MERLSTFGHFPGDESDTYVGSSAATTVVRKPTNAKNDPRTSMSSDGTLTRHLSERNHQILANRHAIEPQTTVHHTSFINPFNYTNLNNSYSGQQLLLTSGDIEAMTMRQFRMGSLGC